VVNEKGLLPRYEKESKVDVLSRYDEILDRLRKKVEEEGTPEGRRIVRNARFGKETHTMTHWETKACLDIMRLRWHPYYLQRARGLDLSERSLHVPGQLVMAVIITIVLFIFSGSTYFASAFIPLFAILRLLRWPKPWSHLVEKATESIARVTEMFGDEMNDAEVSDDIHKAQVDALYQY